MTASIIDEMTALGDTLDPDLAGVRQARGGDAEWLRVRGESERAFIARVLFDATAAGLRRVRIRGALVGSIAGRRLDDDLLAVWVLDPVPATTPEKEQTHDPRRPPQPPDATSAARARPGKRHPRSLAAEHHRG